MLNNEQIEKVLSPISSDAPCGKNAKYDDIYGLFEDEVKKLSSLTGSENVDFDKIERLAVQILSENSKDILVLSYLSYALMKKDSFQGFVQGLSLLSSLLNKYWNDLFPELRRLRARANSLQWWINKCEEFLQSRDDNAIVSTVAYDTLMSELSDLDTILNEKMGEDAPQVYTALKNMIEAKITVDAPEDDPKTTSAVQEETNTLPIKQQEPQEKEVVTPSKASETTRASTPKEIEEQFQKTLENLKELGMRQLQVQDFSSEYFIINRMAVWRGVDAPPNTNGGVSMLPAPEDYQTSMLKNLYSTAQWDELLLNAEASIQQYIFWLDLHFYVAKALEGLNLPEAKGSVEHMLVQFLNRVGDIQTYKFSDEKTAFASHETMAWITSLSVDTSGNGSGATDKEYLGLEVLRKDATRAFQEMKVAEAIGIYTDKIKSVSDKEDELILLMEFCGFLVGKKLDPILTSQLEKMMSLAKRYQLDSWNGKLASKVYQTAILSCPSEIDTPAKEYATKMLTLVDPKIAVTILTMR